MTEPDEGEPDEGEPEDGFETEGETRSHDDDVSEERRIERELEEREGFPTERET
jgi:hypothetical protein